LERWTGLVVNDLITLIKDKGIPLNPDERAIISKPIRRLNRIERRAYYGQMVVKGELIKKVLNEILRDDGEEQILDLTVDSIINKGGEINYLDQLVIDILGPIKVYKLVRERSEERGLVLKATSTTGGCMVLLISFIILIAIIIFILKG